MNKEKNIVWSRTFWVNAVLSLLAMMTALGGAEWVATYPKVAAGIVAAIGALNVVLRWLTDTPVTFGTDTKPKSGTSRW